MASALRRTAPLALPAAAVLFLLSGPVLGATLDEEEYRNAVLSVVLHARALLDGTYPFWTSALGFGLPHPLHPAFIWHPLVPMFAIWEADHAARLLYAVHAALGAAGSWWLVRRAGVTPSIAGIAATTWTLAMPSINYALTDFWPTEFVTWSLAPYVLLAALAVLERRREERQPWTWGVALGLLSGLLVANGHAGIVPVYVAAIVLVIVVDWRAARRVWPALALASLIGAAIAAPTLAQLLSEIRRFPPLPRITADLSLGWPALLDMVLRPGSLWFPGGASVAAHGARVPFFGAPMALLAIAFSLGRLTGAGRRGIGVAFLVCLVLTFATPLNRAGVLSGMYMFRDPMIVLGILGGSLAWHRLAARRRRLAAALGVWQVGALVLVAWPFVSAAWDTSGIANNYLRHDGATAALRRWAAELPGRWYLAPVLDDRIRSGAVLSDGLWTDVWVYRGLDVVNGTFKGVSADPMYPSGNFPLGRIRGHEATASSAPTLAVLGVSAVLAATGEPVAPELEEVARFPVTGGPIRLLRTPGVWRGGALVDAAALALPMTQLPGCDEMGVLCRDLAPLGALVVDPAVDVERAHGAIDVRFTPSGMGGRWLVVSEMFRRQWRAYAGSTPLRVQPIAGALIGVEVPPGVGAVQLRYRPPLLVTLTWIAGLVLLAACATLVLGRRGLRGGTAG